MFKNRVLRILFGSSGKGKGKGRFAGPIQHCSLMADCSLAPEQFLPSSPEALHTKRRERPLPAKEGSLTHEFCQRPVILL
jgi:hypothetical protein